MPFLLIGGISGAGVRWAVGELLSSPATSLLVVNTVGSLILGVVTVLGHSARGHNLEVHSPSPASPIRLGLTVGFCGGLTTFSGLAVELVSRWRNGTSGASALAVTSIAVGLAAIVLGRWFGRRLERVTR